MQWAVAIGGVAGGAALVASLLFLGWQVRLANQLAEAGAVAAFYEANDRAVMQFLTYPELYCYFYDGAELDGLAADSPRYVRAMVAAELFADSIESSYVAAHASPAVARRLDDLRIYAKDLLEGSPAFRKFVFENAVWYAHLAGELREVQAELEAAALAAG